MKRGLALYERILSPLTCLAVTAALEHYTAALAETLLTDERAQALLGTSEVRSMLLWHALEESEHKAVAFDVYRAAGGSERRRIWTMRYITASFLNAVVLHTILSLLADRATYQPRRLAKRCVEGRTLQPAATTSAPRSSPTWRRMRGSRRRRSSAPCWR